MIIEDRPDIIGHIDKIKMFNVKNSYFNESEKWYTEQVDLTIKTLKEYNTIVEINTRGLYRYGQTDLYPGKKVLEKLVKANIPLMINSDAHKPEEIIMGMPHAGGILKNSGVKSIYALRSGKWSEYPFDESGIYWK
jgi:histidinol-phosphatase (PHP family)